MKKSIIPRCLFGLVIRLDVPKKASQSYWMQTGVGFTMDNTPTVALKKDWVFLGNWVGRREVHERQRICLEKTKYDEMTNWSGEFVAIFFVHICFVYDQRFKVTILYINAGGTTHLDLVLFWYFPPAWTTTLKQRIRSCRLCKSAGTCGGLFFCCFGPRKHFGFDSQKLLGVGLKDMFLDFFTVYHP